jgi:hypothetical protein
MKQISVIISDENQHAIADSQISAWYQGVLVQRERTVFVSNNLQLTELRAGIVLKELAPFNVDFHGNILTCCEKGALSDYPQGFFDQQATPIRVLMTGCSRSDAKQHQADLLERARLRRQAKDHP